MPATLRTIVILAAAVIVGALAAPAMAQNIAEADARAVQSVIDSQIGAFRAGDDQKAYSFAAPGIKAVFPTVERFMAMVKGGYQPVYDPQSYRFGRNLLVGDQVHQEVIITDRQGKLWQAVYTLSQQKDGSWKITGVKLNPFTGQSV
ncbi:MAG: hypothetical protein BroJett030_14740 [Alphaproteobacteria bacterium]|nr:MAG: hypothetical protein BroJett030_14740 [Alphaproteobacteria bacterium]